MTTQTPTNLYQYYTGKGQALPSVDARATDAKAAGITGPYTGTGDQNKTLLAYLVGGSGTPAGGATGGTPAAGTPPSGTPNATGTPTGNPITDSGVRRYTGTTPPPGSYAADASAYYSGLDTSTPDPQKIYQNELSQMQAQIDAINNVYAGITAKENANGVTRLGQTRSVNARSGDLGGDFGNANMSATTDFNSAKIDEINRQKSLEISAVLSKVQQRSDDKLKAANELSLANSEKKLAYKKEQETAARSDLTRLAGTGISLDKLTTDEYNKLLTQTGFDPLSFEAAFNGAKSAATKIDYTYHTLGDGKVLRTGVQANGAAVPEKMFDYGVSPEFTVTETKNGQILLVNKKTGEIKNAGNYAPSTGSGGPYVAGADPIVDGWVKNINSGQAKIGDVPNNLQNSVSLGLAAATGSNQNNELHTKALQSAKDLLTKFDSGSGTAAVGKSRIFTLGAVGDWLGTGGNRADFLTNLDNLKSNLSLENVKYLKGQGAVSDAERAMLASASTALNKSQSEAEFRKTLAGIIAQLESGGATPGAPVDNTALQAPATGPGSAGISVQTPDGQTFYFTSQADADAFKQSAGIK